jgi:hypothetical protein
LEITLGMRLYQFVSGEVVARSLRELERSGAIQVNRGSIKIVDGERLLEWM